MTEETAKHIRYLKDEDYIILNEEYYLVFTQPDFEEYDYDEIELIDRPTTEE